MVQHSFSGEGARPKSVIFVHLRDDGRVLDELNVADLVARLHNVIANHVQLQAALVPKAIHDFEKLKNQVILS
jgi:hypothetical protein